MEKYTIKRVKDGSFDGDDGRVPYFWVKLLRLSDGVTLEAGSKRGDFEQGDTLELEVEKTELGNGKFRYKIVSE